MAWALWFGGLGTLLLVVTRLFALNHDMAVKTAPHLFADFEQYQLLLAALAVVGTALWFAASRSTRAAALLWMLGLAAISAILEPLLATNRMQVLLKQGAQTSAEFHALHARAGTLYSIEAVLLLGAGMVLPWALTGRDRVAGTVESPGEM